MTDPDLAAKWARQSRHFETNVHFNKLISLKVIEWTSERVVMRIAHAERLCNSSAGIHGGVVATLADTCGSAASLVAVNAEGFISTVSMNISYLSAALTDLTATGVCIKPGKRIQVASVDITDAGGKLVAHATVTSMVPQ